MKTGIKTAKLISILLLVIMLAEPAASFAYTGSMGFEGGFLRLILLKTIRIFIARSAF